MEDTKAPTLSGVHELIFNLLRANPEGLSIYEIRDALPSDIGVHQHLDKRVRELRQWYDLPGKQLGNRFVYILGDLREDPVGDDGAISSKLRAQIIHKASGRCQMCGLTVKEDGVKLQVDHKIPRNWGGLTEPDNLWAICALCNSGKRDYFGTFDEVTMERLLAPESVYERLLETLRASGDERTPSWLLEFVANFNDFHEDWQRRLRELRYPGIDVDYRFEKEKLPSGKVTTYYILTKDTVLPPNHIAIIHEKRKKKKPDALGD